MSPAELFAHPASWPALLVAPAAWLVLCALDRARERRLARLVGARVARLAPDPTAARRTARRVLFGVALFLALVAVLHPVFGDATREADERGVDVVLCLDVSRSMLAGDVAPDRLARAKREIAALSKHVRGDRLALVAFAGEAKVLVPLTRDARSFADLVEAAGPLSVEKGGTDLGAAIETALSLLPRDGGEHEAIVLVTDGEDLTGHALGAARAAAERGVTVHALGLGTALGAKIALASERGRGFLTDRAGGEVVSAMDAASLRRLAEAANGTFVEAGAGEGALVSLYEDRVVAMARKSFAAEARHRRENRFQWPLLAAVLLLLVELGLPDRRRR